MPQTRHSEPHCFLYGAVMTSIINIPQSSLFRSKVFAASDNGVFRPHPQMPDQVGDRQEIPWPFKSGWRYSKAIVAQRLFQGIELPLCR